MGCKLLLLLGFVVVLSNARLIVGASGTALDGGVLFPGEFSVMVGAFSLG